MTADRATRLSDFADGPRRLDEALAEIPRSAWRIRAEGSDWTVHQILVHLVDSEAHGYLRFRHAIAEPGTAVNAWDQDVWPRALDYHHEDADDAIALFTLLRRRTVALFSHLAPDDWSRTILHPENGAMSVDDLLITYADHVDAHIAQIRAVASAT
ncbi:MAG: DinB family protein [Dehalococcoidia bacterium]